MDHSWRPPSMPPIPVNNNRNICPICSISHFPFCPPPPFAENPRFHYAQPQHSYNHQRPYFDHHHHHPFPNHQTLNYNYDHNPIDGRRPNWHGINPSLDTSPYVGSASYGYDGYDNGGIKRMKIEPIDNNNTGGSFISGGIGDTSRCFPSDNERILKLIHDHGNAANAHQRFGETCEVRDDLRSKRHRDEVGHSQFDLDYSRHNSQPTADSIQNHNLKAHNYQQPYNWSESKGQPNSFGGQPPLPASPPPPLPINPPTKNPYLFPVAVSSSTDSLLSRSENQPSAHVYEEFQKPNIIDASHIFKHPHRASRPDHLVIILRGLPGSGKSYLSKMLRDIEVENGGEAPRIHSMDEYFMTEVEKAEDSEVSGSLRGKRQVTKTVMEYCYEPEMEEAYRASMLKAFKKTLDEGVYSFIIVDDRNLRVADFAQFWAVAKRSGYEVYLVEASYKDPAGCAARNVHNFSLDDIQNMATQWEEAPSLYLRMDIKSLLHGDGFDESGIQEVDMDMEDEDASQGSETKSPQDKIKDEVDDFTHNDVNDDNPMRKNEKEQVKDLSKSKWSNNDLDGNDLIEANNRKNGLSGLIQAYSKEGKSLRWGDQGGNIGFSISASRKTNTKSLVIGPGPGYNLKSNPLSEEEYVKPVVESKSQSVFQEQIRAEKESFKAVFDKRKHRIGGFNIDDE